MNSLPANDRELIQQLLDDTRVLSDTFTIGRPAPALVRTLFAPVLRRWIVEGGFFKAAKLIRPHEPIFEIMTIPNAVKLCKSGVYEHWMAGFTFDGLYVGAGLLTEPHRSNPPAKVHPVTASHRANAFFTQKMFFWKGQFYTRADIVGMHANRLGGVHLDFRRKPNEAHIDELKNYFGYELLAHKRQMLMGPEIAVARADLTRRNSVYDATELVAIDTANIFAKGILASRSAFTAALVGGSP
jgi:hypothetical protein